MLKRLIDRDPADYLKMLLISLFVMATAIVVIAIAEFTLPEGLVAESIALIAVLVAVPAICIGSIAFVLMIVSRFRTILRKKDDC